MKTGGQEKSPYAFDKRSSFNEILNANELISSQKVFTELFGSLTGVSAIVNKNRQIVFSNNGFLEMLGIDSLETILGKRLGEAISCANSELNVKGCGTSEACKYCGVINVILESIRNNRRETNEARILTQTEGKLKSWDLRITSSPVKFNSDVFYVLALQDISSEKKLQTLERVFFHDLLNTAGGLNGLLVLLKLGVNSSEADELIRKSEEASHVILEEIQSYSQLRAAENGDILVKAEKVNSLEILESSITRIAFHEVGQNKRIEITANAASIDFETDRLLLQRVIINLLKNALEATPEKGVVKVSVADLNNKLLFSIQNVGAIPENVRLQIFQRSFSTKNIARGIGTFSVKLVTENYLNGKVSFISNEKDGTIFMVELNKYLQ